MNPVEFKIIIEITEVVKEHLTKMINSELGTKFYIKSNGDIGSIYGSDTNKHWWINYVWKIWFI